MMRIQIFAIKLFELFCMLKMFIITRTEIDQEIRYLENRYLDFYSMNKGRLMLITTKNIKNEE